MKFIYSFAPKDLEYNKLRNELNRLRAVIVDSGWGEPVPDEKFLGSIPMPALTGPARRGVAKRSKKKKTHISRLRESRPGTK